MVEPASALSILFCSSVNVPAVALKTSSFSEDEINSPSTSEIGSSFTSSIT